MNIHSIEMTTIEVTTGRKYTVRKKLTPRILTLISSASTSARPAWMGTTNMANSTVLRSDFQNSGSPNSRVKLSKPTNCGPVGETSFALVKASAKVKHDRDDDEDAARRPVRPARRRRCAGSAAAFEAPLPRVSFSIW